MIMDLTAEPRSYPIPIEIPPHVLMLYGIGRDSNVYTVRDGDEAIIVDTGTGVNWHVYAKVWAGYLGNVRRVVIFNTHEHFDHIGGNHVLKRWLEGMGIEVSFAAHRITAKVIEEGKDEVILSHYYGRKFEAHPVDIKLEDGEKLKIGSLKLLVIHTPGHTAGSSCLYLDDGKHKVMFTGDTVFEGTAGRTDLPTGDDRELRKSLEKLLRFDVDFCLPGHGGVIKNWKENLANVLGWLR